MRGHVCVLNWQTCLPVPKRQHVAALHTPSSYSRRSLFPAADFAPAYHRPVFATPTAFKEMTPAQAKETDGWKSAAPKDTALRGKWWEMFQTAEVERAGRTDNRYQQPNRWRRPWKISLHRPRYYEGDTVGGFFPRSRPSPTPRWAFEFAHAHEFQHTAGHLYHQGQCAGATH